MRQSCMRQSCAAFFGLIIWAAAVSVQAADPRSIRIGYAISKTGAYATGANTSTLPNYRLWVRDVNDSGGIMLKDGQRHRIEVIEYDDQSDPIEAQKAVETLATGDKVDFILAPWGATLNLAVAPQFNRFGYPELSASLKLEQASDFVKNNPWTFLEEQPSYQIESLVRILMKLRDERKIGNDVAMATVADSFGANLAAPAHAALRREKFNLVYDRTYPVGARDMKPVVSEAAAVNPDVFLALSYPSDTFGITARAIELKFEPKVFFVAVGAAYPSFRQQFGPNAEGVLGAGGWDPSLPALKAYLARHVAVTGREPDRWVSPVTYATLQILQQAIERVGTLDRVAILEEIKTRTFDTQMGPLRYQGNILDHEWHVGQWQNGEFYGVAPASMPGARTLVFPKAPWRSPE